MNSVSPKGNTPPLGLSELARRVRHDAVRAVFEGKSPLFTTFTATCPGLNTKGVHDWIYMMVHHGFEYKSVVWFINALRGQLEFIEKEFTVLKDKFGQDEAFNKLGGLLVRARQYLEGAAKAVLKTRESIRSFLVDLMDRIAIRPCDEDIP